MPIYTYAPHWESMPVWFKKFKPLVKGYTGLAGIRLHRTGYPLSFELFGSGLPEKELYPLLTFQMRNGESIENWAWLETEFEIPWVNPKDFHRFRTNPMDFYHADDILEPIAEEILKTVDPSEELLRRVLVDHAALAAKA